jgi:predicted porin
MFKHHTLSLAVFTACAAWSAVAAAQTSVQLYGSVDAGLSYVSNERGKGNTRVDSGNRSPDRFGFRGTEDLGNGTTALFTVESGFNVDDGTLKKSTALFNRRAVVGLSSRSYGTLTVGHMPDFLYDYLRFQSNGIMGSSYFFHPGNLDNQASTFQIDNAVRYETADLHGFKLGAMYGFGEDPEDSSKNRSYSAGAQYAAGPLKANLAYTVSNGRSFNLGAGLGIRSLLGQNLSSDPAAPNATYTNFVASRTTSVGATASYQVGRFTPHAMYSRIELENRVGSAAQSNYELGSDIETGGNNTLGVSVGISRFAGVRWNQFNVIDMLHLSKRTTLYAAVAYQHASNGLAVINGLAPSSTSDLQQTGICT